MNCSDQDIKKSIKEVVDLCKTVKLGVSSKVVPPLPETFIDTHSLGYIQAVLNSYEDNYDLTRNSIYHDSKAHPRKHLKAMYIIAKICEENNWKEFVCFPTKSSFIPSFITIDSKILHFCILGRTGPLVAPKKMTMWASLLNLDVKAFRPQGPSDEMQFRGTIYTDGVGVSILKQNTDTVKSGGARTDGPKKSKKKKSLS